MQQFRDGPVDVSIEAIDTNAAADLLAADAASSLSQDLDALPEIAWSTSTRGHTTSANQRWLAHTGLDAPAMQDWTEAVHPDEQTTVRHKWAESLASGAPFEATVRLRRADGRFGWVIARAAAGRNADGAVTRWLCTAADIDALKASETQVSLVAGELAHRIGNVFAVIDSILVLSARIRPEAADFAASARARIEALAQANDYIWPQSPAADAPPERLHGLFELLLRPYAEEGGPEIELSGDDAPIGASAATFIALIFHELATNAVKYGALSGHLGRLVVRTRRSPRHLTIIWAETGGPAIRSSPDQQGFGTALVDRAMKMGLASRSRRWWRPTGLAIAMRFNLEPLAR